MGAAFSRSQELVKGHFWQVFGTIVLVFILLIAVGLVIGLILLGLPVAVGSSSAASCPALWSRRSWRWS